MLMAAGARFLICADRQCNAHMGMQDLFDSAAGCAMRWYAPSHHYHFDATRGRTMMTADAFLIKASSECIGHKKVASADAVEVYRAVVNAAQGSECVQH